MQIYGSSVNGPVRHKCLSVIGKLMYFSSTDMLQSLLSGTNISRYPFVVKFRICELGGSALCVDRYSSVNFVD